MATVDPEGKDGRRPNARGLTKAVMRLLQDRLEGEQS